jgi:hypothetical protein
LLARVIAYEPVPLFRAFFEYSVHLNDLTHLIDIRATVVSWVVLDMVIGD